MLGALITIVLVNETCQEMSLHTEICCAGCLAPMLLKSPVQTRTATGKMPAGDLCQFLICSQELPGTAQTGLGQTTSAPRSQRNCRDRHAPGPRNCWRSYCASVLQRISPLYDPLQHHYEPRIWQTSYKVFFTKELELRIRRVIALVGSPRLGCPCICGHRGPSYRHPIVSNVDM